MSGTQTLLADYVKNGSERAFRDLVTSYIDFVFATALRVVGGDRPLAEDVSQTVFTDLARKAVMLPRDVKLGGWLHRHTCFVGRKALRRERRRIARERQAMQLTTIEDYTQENLAQLSTILDETINGLGKEDRNAIILRFFEQLDYRALGAALGSTEDAARMRVSRALEKMGAILRRRGVAMSVGGLTFVLSTRTVAAAPVGLAAKVSQLALAQSLKGWAALSFLKEACLTRLNLGLAGGGAVVVLAVLILLIPARHTQAVLDTSKEIKQPVDFAGFADEESETADQASLAPPAAPAPSQLPVAVPAVWKPVAVVTFPKTNASAPLQPSPAAASPVPQPAPPVASTANPAVPTSSTGAQSMGSGSAQAGLDVFGPPPNRRNYGQPPVYPPSPSQPTAPNLAAATKAAAPVTNVIPKMIIPPPSPAYPGGVQVAAPAQNPQLGNPPASLVLRANRNNQNNRQRQP